MSAVAFFRLKCDGGCGRWLSDVVGDNVPKLTTVRSRALVFPDAGEAMDQSVTVGWTKCRCPLQAGLTDKHTSWCEVGQGVSLCGNCRAKKTKTETET